MSNNVIQEMYNQVRKFNEIAGNIHHSNHEAALDGIEAQLSFIGEELQEGYQAFTEGDSVELVDACADLFVTVAGLMQRLEGAGCNVEKALARVCANNLEKYVKVQHFAQHPELQPENTTAVDTGYGYIVFKRDIDNKICKPTNFQPVNLAGCVSDIFGLDKGE